MEENINSEIKPESTREKDTKLELFDWIQCIVTALVVGILVFIFAFRVVTVDGDSMYPTLHHTDKLITTNLFYTPRQGDIIVFQTDTFGDSPLVKRVIATEGQTVNIDFDAGIVYVDGVALEESEYVNAPTYVRENFTGEVTVPEGCLFVMGDNRNASEDSRSDNVGFVDERCIIGKVLLIAFPAQEKGEGLNLERVGSPY